MDDEVVLWSSPRKRIRRGPGRLLNDKPHGDDYLDTNADTSSSTETKLCSKEDLEFSPEVAALMSAYGLSVKESLDSHNKKVESDSDKSSNPLVSKIHEVSQRTPNQGTSSGNSSGHGSVPVCESVFQPAVHKANARKRTHTEAASESVVCTSSVASNSKSADTTPAYWSYTGTSFVYSHPNLPPRNASASVSAQDSTEFNYFAPIQCTPLNPWYLSNG